MMYGYSRSSRVPSTRPGRPILASPGVPSRITFASIRAIISKLHEDCLFAIHSKTRSNSHLAAGSNVTLMLGAHGSAGRPLRPESFLDLDQRADALPLLPVHRSA